MNYYRFDGRFCKEFSNDVDAMEEAIGYHDDRPATLEKWIDNRWCPAYYGQWKVGGEFLPFDFDECK